MFLWLGELLLWQSKMLFCYVDLCGKPTVPVTSKKCFYGWQRCPFHQFLQEGEILIENPEKMPTF
jgi:hypothetical protein